MNYVNMTLLFSAAIGLFCAFPILTGPYDNPIDNSVGTFVSGFLFTVPFAAAIAILVYILLNSFIVQFIVVSWLTIFTFINYNDLNYYSTGINYVNNMLTALGYAVSVYSLYTIFTN
jgi:hypothetical protein